MFLQAVSISTYSLHGELLGIVSTEQWPGALPVTQLSVIQIPEGNRCVVA